MAAPTLTELLAAQSKDQIKAALLADLAGLGFPVTDWNSGGVVRTIIEALCGALARLYVLVASIAGAGFLSTSSGAWLTLVAAEVYQLARNPTTFTQGRLVLTCPASAGPYTITPGQLWFASASGKRFTNTTGGTLSTSSTLAVTIQAEGPGSAYNVPAGTILTMLTPLPGVTCNNPLALGVVSHTGSGSGTVTPSGTPSLNALVLIKIVAGGGVGVATFRYSLDGGLSWFGPIVTGGGVLVINTGMTLAFSGTFVAADIYSFSTSWITSSGNDEEADGPLRSRCQARWPSLGVAPTREVYDLWARTAAPTVVKTISKPSATIPGQVDLYLATAAGATPGAAVTTVANYVAAREPLMLTSNVQSAAPKNVAVQATLYIQSGYQAAALELAEANIEALIAAQDIGPGTVYVSELISALTTPAGVRNVVVALPAADVSLAAGEVAALSPAPVLTVVVV